MGREGCEQNMEQGERTGGKEALTYLPLDYENPV